MEKLTLKGITHPASLELTEGMVSLGRNPTNDFRIPDPTVSSFHCEMIVSGETVLVRDLSSTNGTFIDGEPIQESFLQPWQTLRLGQAELRLELQSDAIPEVRIPTPEKIAPPNELLDGRPACHHHPGVEAALRCTSCGRLFCSSCVKPIGLRGAQKRLFCPVCSKPCVPRLEAAEPREKQSWIGRLTQTIRIRLGQG